MKKAGLVALLCCLLGFLTVRSFEFNDSNLEAKIKKLKLKEKIINREVKDVIRQRSVMVRNSEGLGTGVIVSPDRDIITAQHVVGELCDPNLKIIFYDQTEVGPGNVTVVYSNEKSDFALLKINKKTMDYAPIVSMADMRHLEGGDKLWLCGNSYTLSFLLVNEITFLAGAHDPSPMPIEQRLFYFDDFSGPGGSGGGIFTKTGGLAGIFLGANWNLGFTPANRALHADSIRYFLDQKQIHYKIQPNYNNP